jgi:hypothetical protein
LPDNNPVSELGKAYLIDAGIASLALAPEGFEAAAALRLEIGNLYDSAMLRLALFLSSPAGQKAVDFANGFSGLATPTGEPSESGGELARELAIEESDYIQEGGYTTPLSSERQAGPGEASTGGGSHVEFDFVPLSSAAGYITPHLGGGLIICNGMVLFTGVGGVPVGTIPSGWINPATGLPYPSAGGHATPDGPNPPPGPIESDVRWR